MARASGRRAVRSPNKPDVRNGFGLGFFKQTFGELKRVVWPTREQATRLSILVIIVSIFVGILLGVLDLGFSQLFRLIAG